MVASLNSALVLLFESSVFDRLLMFLGGGGGTGGLGDRNPSADSSRSPALFRGAKLDVGGFISRLFGGGVFGGTEFSLALDAAASH